MTYTGGWMDGWMDGRMDGWMDGWTDEAILVGTARMRRILNTSIAPILTYFTVVTFSTYHTQFTAVTYSSESRL